MKQPICMEHFLFFDISISQETIKQIHSKKSNGK